MVKRIAPLFMFVFALGACDAILQIPDRRLDPHVICSGGSCQCAAGFMSCSGKDDGCETDVSQPNNCGGCGITCSNAACVGGKCQCNTGYQDCDGMAANGCETFVENNKQSCGACGHDCLGGECMGGVCQVVVLAKDVGPLDMAVGPDHVYYLTLEGLFRVPKTGGAPEQLAADKTAKLVTVGPDAVYWSIPNQVQVMPLDKSKPPALFADMVSPAHRMAICGTSVCWLESTAAMPPVTQMVRVPLAGGPKTEIPVSAYDSGVYSDKNRAYWVTSGNDIVAMDHNKMTVDTLASVSAAYGVVPNSTDLYWDDDSAINKIPLAGGMPEVLITTAEGDLMVGDDKNLYYASWNDSSVTRVSLSTKQSSKIYPGSIAYINMMAIDDKAVYWGSDNDIVAIAK